MDVYEKHIIKEPSLPFIFQDRRHARVKGDTPGYRNWHENVEILCFVSGTATIISNEQHFEVAPGDIAVINANCVHGIVVHEKLHYYCLIVDRSFCLSNHFDTNLLSFTPHIHDTALYTLMEETAAIYADADMPCRVQMIRANALKIMAILCSKYSTASDRPHTDTHLLSCVKRALGYIHTACQSKLTLDLIAGKVGLSKYYLAREFRRITGNTVVEFIKLARCERAKQLLTETEMSIESIAHACGFANFSYFTRTFSAITGMRPSQYRAKSTQPPTPG